MTLEEAKTNLPEGYALVPKKPTQAMLRAFIQCPEDELELAYEVLLMMASAGK